MSESVTYYKLSYTGNPHTDRQSYYWVKTSHICLILAEFGVRKDIKNLNSITVSIFQ